MAKDKGGAKKSGKKDSAPVCAMCKNYRPGKKMCAKRDKKRAPDDKACDSFKRR